MSDVILRHATAKDVETFYGSSRRETMRAVVAVRDGEPIGIAGIAHQLGALVMFSDLKPEMYRYRKAILRAGRMVTEMAKGLPVYAVADPELESSARFLEAIGFHHVYPSSAGEVFLWQH